MPREFYRGRDAHRSNDPGRSGWFLIRQELRAWDLMGDGLWRVVQGKLVLQAPRKEAKRQSDARKCGHATEWRIFAPTMHRSQDFYSALRAVIFAANFRGGVRDLMFFDIRTTQEGCSTIVYPAHS